MGVARRGMPQESTDHQYEPQAQASFSRGGIPLRTVSGVGVLDPPLPPRKQPGSLTPIAASLLQRVLALIILIGVAVIAALLFAQR